MKLWLLGMGAAALATEAVHAQANRFGASPAEYRSAAVKIAMLEGDLAGLSRRYGVPVATLQAISRGRVRSAPTLGGGMLRESLRKLALDAAGLRQEIATLRATVGNLERGSKAGSESELHELATELARASKLVDAGDLGAAGTLLSRIKQNALHARTGGLKLWADLVKAEAKLRYLSGDIDGFEETLVAANDELLRDSTELSWDFQQEHGERLLLHAEELQDVAGIARAAEILQRDALPLSVKLGNEQRLRTLKDLCRASISLHFEAEVSAANAPAHTSQLGQILATCALASRMAELAPQASRIFRAQAHVSYAFILSFYFAVLKDDELRAKAEAEVSRALALTRSSDPASDLASLYISAGDAYVNLHLNEGAKQRKSIGFFETAIQQVDTSATPSLWAAAHQRLGGMYLVSFESTGSRADLLRAKSHLENSASVYTRTYSELAWARTLANLARIRGELGMGDSNRAMVAASVNELKAAEALLAGSRSQMVLKFAAQNRRRFEEWLSKSKAQ